jgi:single-stranded-DNA-specific exonuclease
MLLLDMAPAVARLRKAIANHELIEIHGDYDVDGTTSTVILKTAIEMCGGRAGFFIPHRIRDGYGIRQSAIERAAQNGAKLIVSVDTGIRAQDAVRRANELGMDVIVTDHHLPEGLLPPALAVINPNRPGCNYPEKNLCGAGVAFKVAQALLATLGWPKEKFERMLASFLKMAAIATVADVVPLTGENRIMVYHGLRGLASVRNPGLRALLDAAGVVDGRAPTAHQVGFRIAPRINAAGRMASAEEVIELFLGADPEKARRIAERLSLLNTERQEEETRVIEEILEQCEAAASLDAAMVFAGDGWHRGVLGIVASRLVERFCRPCFVLGTQNGETAGSGRSIPAFHLLDSLESMPHLFIKFGGHRQAAGVTMATENVAEFRRSLVAFAGSTLKPEDFEPVQRIDATLRFSQINDAFWNSLQRLEPFGMGNPAPVFAARDVEIVNQPTLMKERHMKFAAAQDGRVLYFKAFNLSSRIAEIPKGARMDLAFKIEADDFNGGWSAKVCDFRAGIGGSPA